MVFSSSGVNLSLREQDLMFPDLPKDLDGLRLVQLTDIHLSPFLSERVLARAVDMANETRAHVALITGDLISTARDPLDICLRQLSRVRADAGIFGCMGNHEIYANAEDYVEQQGARMGHRYLRQRAESLKFGQATLNFAGVDYQPSRKPYLVGAEKMVAPDAFNVLLSHNPDVFPVAAKQGYQLTIAGHTHGGQVRVEILRADLNIAQVFHPLCGRALPAGPGGDLRLARHRNHRPSRPAGSPAGSESLTLVPYMMAPYLIVSDIHGNYEALEAVLEDARGRYDRILCLGDLVGYGADPNRVAEWAKANVVSIVRGNHDRACTGTDSLEYFNPAARLSALWTRGALTPGIRTTWSIWRGGHCE